MRLTLQAGKRTTWIEVTRLEKIIRVSTSGSATEKAVREAITTWCSVGAHTPDPRLQFRSSGCGCDNSRVHSWTFPAAMLTDYGPLPFTAGSEEIRWRWWHYFGQGARFEVTEDDLPGGDDAEGA